MSSLLTEIPSTTSSVELAPYLDPATGHRVLTIENASSADLYVLIGDGDAASDQRSLKLAAGDYYEAPLHLAHQRHAGAWASANGQANVTKVTF